MITPTDFRSSPFESLVDKCISQVIISVDVVNTIHVVVEG